MNSELVHAVDDRVVERLVTQILRLEIQNCRTNSFSNPEMVSKIQKCFEAEVN